MSRLYVLKLCSVMKNARTPECVLNRLHLKYGDRSNSAICRGYTQYFSELAPRIYPLYRLLDRVLSDCPVKLSTTAKEEYRKYDNKYRRHYKHLGILLSSLGFIVAFCDAPNFAGRYLIVYIIDVYVYVKSIYNININK